MIEERYEGEGVIISARLSEQEAQRFQVILAKNGLSVDE